MSKKIYSVEEIEILKQNKYVKNCSSKYITFTDELKIEALKLDEKRVYFRDIFRYFGFPDFVVDSDVSKQALKSWRSKLKNKGFSGLVNTKKGRKKKNIIDISKMSKDEELEYLRAKVAYLEEIQKLIKGGEP